MADPEVFKRGGNDNGPFLGGGGGGEQDIWVQV